MEKLMFAIYAEKYDKSIMSDITEFMKNRDVGEWFIHNEHIDLQLIRKDDVGLE